MTISKYEQTSLDCKAGWAAGTVPKWMSTAGLQMFNSNYLYQADNPKEQFARIAQTAAKHAPQEFAPSDNLIIGEAFMGFETYWTHKFFEVLWNGWMACSTPVLSNMGTDRGSPVSCAGSAVGDSIKDFYDNISEMAVLTKEGFGTASDMSSIRCRGTRIKGGGKASGVMPVIEDHIIMARKVRQGTRRGAWAAYLNIGHGDFWEVIQYLEKNPDDFNMGWIITDEFIARMKRGDDEAHRRFKRAMKVKMIFGKGYYFFIDKVNRNRPEVYKDLGFMVKASQLCTEIFLHSDEKNHTYTCVLAWMNASKYDEWKDTDAPFVATVFLDCVVSEFIERASSIKGMEKAVASTVKGRAIGLGLGGFHTYLQANMIPFESVEAHMWNIKLFKGINEQSLAASKWLAVVLGEPEWLKGYGLRFTHRMAVAPTKSTALIYGGISEGINPDAAMSFTQKTAAGDVDRLNPVLLALIKAKGLNLKECLADLVKGYGSVQHVDWLTDFEKLVFKTAFEIDMKVVIRLAAARQKFIDQGQSLNLFFSKDAKESYIAEVHQEAFLNEMIHSLYYVYSSRAVISSNSECVACQ